jgi:hypothetical protein
MDEESVKEKLNRANEAERLKAEEKKRAISERSKRLQELKKYIEKEIQKYDLPIGLEGIDKEPFAEMNNRQHYLIKEKGTKNIGIVFIEMGRRNKQVISDFIEIRESWGDEEALLKLKNRIPVFIEYLVTKIS